ncbi:MAG: class I tRNA ligase family protein [Ilumatobacteraceae bacterium]
MSTIPERPSLDGIEAVWAARWDEDGTYRFTPSAHRDDVFAIDTPPPTVSGSIHMGTIFGYTQTDAIARYQRMTGKSVFYPIGWDDNGLATERACRTSTACAATRRCRTTPTSSRRPSRPSATFR